MNWVYQIIGFGALLMLGLSYWQSEKRQIMLWQMAGNLLFAIHYFFLSARSGALCSLFQIIVLLLFTMRDRFGWKRSLIAFPILFIFGLIAAITYETPVTLLPILGSVLSLLPFFQSNRTVIQVAGVFSALAWLVYVISVHSYSGIVTESVLAILTFTSILKRSKASETPSRK